MQGIVQAIARVSGIMAEISSASAEQASGISQVLEAVEHMDRMTQQNAALVEETAAASQALRSGGWHQRWPVMYCSSCSMMNFCSEMMSLTKSPMEIMPTSCSFSTTGR